MWRKIPPSYCQKNIQRSTPKSIHVCAECRIYTYIKDWPSLGSRISTVAAVGNSITPITGSDSRIWKVSACSYFPSVSIRTRHVALDCPGLNWTCLWDLPLKSSSFFALPSWVPMPERYGEWWTSKKKGEGKGEQARWVKNKTNRKKWRQKKGKRPLKGDRKERETDEKQIRYSHPLMLFREWCEKERCVYFSSLITYRASGMCEMNLWLKRLNKHLPPCRDGLATTIVSQGLGMHASVCASPFLFKCLLFHL